MRILLLLLLLTGCMTTDSAERPGPHGLYISGGVGGF